MAEPGTRRRRPAASRAGRPRPRCPGDGGRGSRPSRPAGNGVPRRASMSTSSRSPRLTTSTAAPVGPSAHGGANALDQAPVPETPRGAEARLIGRLRRRPLQPELQVAYVLLEPVGLPLEGIVVEVAVKRAMAARPGARGCGGRCHGAQAHHLSEQVRDLAGVGLEHALALGLAAVVEDREPRRHRDPQRVGLGVLDPEQPVLHIDREIVAPHALAPALAVERHARARTGPGDRARPTPGASSTASWQ